MIRIILTALTAIFAVSNAFAAASAPGQYVVTASTLNVRLAPQMNGQTSSRLGRGQVVDVLEVRDGWARISNYFDGAGEGLSGDVARWVYAVHLSIKPAEARPAAKPAKKKVIEYLPAQPPPGEEIIVSASILEAISSSDDLPKYQSTFAWVSARLVDTGTCKVSDFRDIGGWWRSTDHKPRPVYYTYCGGGSNSNRIFVDTSTGETFR